MFSVVCACAQLCLTLCDPMGCSSCRFPTSRDRILYRQADFLLLRHQGSPLVQYIESNFVLSFVNGD